VPGYGNLTSFRSAGVSEIAGAGKIADPENLTRYERAALATSSRVRQALWSSGPTPPETGARSIGTVDAAMSHSMGRIELRISTKKRENPGTGSMPDGSQELSEVGRRILRHWCECRPKTVKRLKASGKLYDTVEQAAAWHEATFAELIQAGLAEDQADELAREPWIIPERSRR